jgi:hypothetical protein
MQGEEEDGPQCRGGRRAYGKCAARLAAAIDLVVFTIVDPTGKRGGHTCCQCQQRMEAAHQTR